MMNEVSGYWLRSLLLCLILVLPVASPLAADSVFCDGQTKAVTTKDPRIPLEELEILLKPLMRCELAEEAKGWLGLLRAKVQEISDGELVSKHKKSEAKKAKQALDALEEAKETMADAAGDSSKPKASQAELAQAEAVLAEAEKQIAEVADEKGKTEKAVDASVAKQVLSKPDAKDEESSETGKQALEVEKSAAQQLDRIKTTQLKDQQSLQQAADAAAQLADSKAKIRKNLLEQITKLQAERTALIDRANLVIDAFEKKGGDAEPIKEYRQYIKAVSGIKVDVSDVDATTTAVWGWMLSKEGGLRWLKNIALFMVILTGFYFLSVFFGRMAERALSRSRRTSALLSDFLAKSVQRGIIALGIIMGLAALEVNIGPVLAVIGALGFVVAFALQNSLGNFASGILILLYRPFDVGDVVEVSGVLGKVSSMNLLSTHIKTPDNKSVIVPNNAVWGSVITNATGTERRRVDLVFGIGYQDDIARAQRVMEEIITSHDLVLKDPAPVVKLHELGESSVNFVCRPWCKTEHYWDVYWDVTRAVKERFDAEGISIPFPQRDVHIITEQPALPESGSSGTNPV